MSGFTYLYFVAVPSFCSLIALYNYIKPEPKPSLTSYVRVILKSTRMRPQETVFIISVQMKNGVIQEFGVCEHDYSTVEKE